MLNSYALRRALSDKKYKKIFVERLTEPLHLNLISAGVALFGSYRAKVAFDLMVRQQYAFPVLFAADEAKKLGLKRIQVLEFGVATGAGLLNLCDCAARTEAERNRYRSGGVRHGQRHAAGDRLPRHAGVFPGG